MEKKNKKEYIAPDFRSEKVFEINAPACGKCYTGPTGGYACTRLIRNS
jgi:hypothetical protein